MTEEEKKEEAAVEQVAPEVTVSPEAELQDMKDKYFRALAEIENTRKRLTREKLESQSYAIQNVIADFLQPLDHFEKALTAAENASSDVKHWAVGFEMILQQMKQVLGDHGVVGFDSLNQPFDPHFHEAIETEETSSVAPGIVLQEVVRGYKIGNRVIRPAKVKVSTAPIQNSAS